ncbi:hypothetical protein ACT3CD_04655 [Geofilum sp. OHC36d9]|uniref:hypothetical protein n=1 Tax=Geofilum sp. OHC36d9 TaxID=3458413 RepID=UPI0040331D79
MRKNIFLLISVFCLLITSCQNLYSTSKRQSKFYKTFFAGDEGIRYFIKPITLQNKKESIDIDITFTSNTVLKDSATINYSLQTNQLINKLQKIFISNGTDTLYICNNHLLFLDRNKHNFTSRFSGRMPAEDLKKLFANNKWTATIISENQIKHFDSKKRAGKTIDFLNNYIFILLQ